MIKLMIKCGLLPLKIALDYFSILDHASTTFQLKIKEAIHIQWELTTHLAILFANRGEFDRGRKSPIYDMPDIGVNANRGGRRKSQSLHRAHLAIFADRLDRLAKSLSTSLVLHESGECC